MKKKRLLQTVSALLLAGCTAVLLPASGAKAAAPAVCASYADSAKRIAFGTDYTIMVRLSGKFITAASDGNVEQWEARGDGSQSWYITDAGGGYVAFRSAADHTKAITVESGDSTDGSNFSLAEYTGSAAQMFKLNPTDDAFYITAKCSGNAAMDVYDISYENGANIDQWDYWGGEGQKFYIRPAEDKYCYLRGDLDFDGVLTAKDLTLQKRGILNGFDRLMAGIAHCGDYITSAYVPPDQDPPQASVNHYDAEALRDYLTAKRNEFFSSTSSVLYREGQPVAYLFAYFLGNAPEQERLSYAISRDGYHFTALNGGKAVWQSSVGTKCIRDPYIFKGEDGLWHLLATDMKSSLGWSSNRNLISAKSTDLVHWFDESLIEIANKYPNMQGCDRAWAPQAIWDPDEKSYMIYFAARVPGTDDRTVMYYAYSKDLMKLDTAPKLLFAPANGNDAIDSDIIYERGKYYMYYKNETNKRIYLATADKACGPYKEIKQISEGNLGVEGPNIYRLIGKNEWVMMSDAYGDGYYVMQKTDDLETFTTVSRSDYSFEGFTPRHGYVIRINQDQYKALSGAFGGGTVPVYNTGIENSTVRFQAGTADHNQLPETVTAYYSDGGSAELPVGWETADVAAIDFSKPGTYTVHGAVQAASYSNPFIEERADPFVTDGGDGYFYFTASYPAYGSVDKGYDRIILRRSTTVAGLAGAEEKTIWKAHASGIMAKHIWAPEMHKIGGKWYMFFAAGASGDIWAIRPYVLKCDGDPYTGTWTECGQMQASAGDSDSFTSFSLDMTYFENNGKHYVIWAEIKGDSSLFMAEISESEPWKLISKPILLTKPEYDWELVNHRVNEGAAVLKTGGKVYVFFSASGTGSEYCVGRMEAAADADLMDIKSWKKESRPVLSSADVPGESGPGHNSFVTDERGNLLIVYHARPSSHDSKSCGTYASDPLYDPCRHTRIRQVYLDVDGVPNIAVCAEDFLAPANKNVTLYVTVTE
ncbi:MAG: family 43 glycosylhydrolase [Oscillospiraceae bacterium]|nr:family 43 glycosylhydrolase [Oscillospiraceae bacterium]